MGRVEEFVDRLAGLTGGSPQQLAALLETEPGDISFRRALQKAVEDGVLVAFGETRSRRYVRADERRGVGDCPKRPEGFGHVWRSWREDERRPCVFCGVPGRGKRDANGRVLEPGYFDRATADRAELFSRLRTPDSIKAWGKAER